MQFGKSPLFSRIHLSLEATRRILIILVATMLLMLPLLAAIIFAVITSNNKGSLPPPTSTTPQPTNTSPPAQSLIDLTQLPLGDGKFLTSAEYGHVYSCQTSFHGRGGTQGPWIDRVNQTWDATRKLRVDGDVKWPGAHWQSAVSGLERKLQGNGLPMSHNTGIFPVQRADDVFKYDPNPNTIRAHQITITLPVNPTVQRDPSCVGNVVGIALTGVPIYNAFDAAGRDAVATETQDTCDGHPQQAGHYHYHGYSTCFKDNTSPQEHSAVLGYALDGFGIFGLRGENGQELTTSDLDECHGHNHAITWDGKDVSMYHYHFTRDFPYTVGCFRGQPVKGAQL